MCVCECVYYVSTCHNSRVRARVCKHCLRWLVLFLGASGTVVMRMLGGVPRHLHFGPLLSCGSLAFHEYPERLFVGVPIRLALSCTIPRNCFLDIDDVMWLTYKSMQELVLVCAQCTPHDPRRRASALPLPHTHEARPCSLARQRTFYLQLQTW